MTQVTELKNIRAKKLEVGKTYVAMVWHNRVRREMVEVTVTDITDVGLVTDKMEFVFTTENKVTFVKQDDKMKYVTWKVAKIKKEYPLVKIETAKQEVKPATKKRVRKPLTAKQKARKNELARARRAAKRAAKA